jgi:O-antigen ligase
VFFINSKLFKNILPFLFLLMPFFLVAGPFLSDLAVCVIAIYFVVNLFRKKYLFLINNNYFYFYIFFCSYFILCSLLSSNIILSLSSSLFYFRFGFFVLGSYILINEYKFIKKYFFISLFTILFLLIFDSHFQLLFRFNLFGYEVFQNNRITSFFLDEIVLGSYLSRLSILFIGFVGLFAKKNSLMFFLSLFIYMMSFSSIFISGERTAILYSLISFIIIFAAFKDFRKAFLIHFMIGILLMIIISINYPLIIDRVFYVTIDQINLFNGRIVIFSEAHESHYFTAMKIFQDYPIFGSGPKLFRELCSLEIYNTGIHSCTTHPHNTYIQLLSETGILGFALLCILYFFFSYLLFLEFYKSVIKKTIKINYFKFSLLLMIFINFFPFVPNGNFFNNWLNVFYYLPFPFLINEYINSNSDDNF